jgi:FtsP/CotA-like multicopper oxidase with cupredoxin domain
MDLGHLDRRGFLAVGGGGFICTLAGEKLRVDEPADLDRLARNLKTPPKVAKARARGDGNAALMDAETGAARTAAPVSLASARGVSADREYWIRAEKKKWKIVPTEFDEMMGRPVSGKTRFEAWVYREYEPDFAAPLGSATIPGPLIEANVGESVAVHFQNAVSSPVTIHPHGIFYTEEFDGSYKGEFTDPGGFVQPGETFTYQWDAREGTSGLWLYHDHGPMDPVPTYKGLFGGLIIRDPADPNPPDVEHFVFMHALTPVATGLSRAFSCVNGRAYAGNTPTFEATVGQRVAFHVVGIDNDFHTFHLHGHRWQDGVDGPVIDTKTIGPAESYSLAFDEDNAGRWFYHCHVFSHLHMGMNGWYVVSP